ncbi:MAG: ribosome recycling factor [Chloroflexi bacterium]|nr:ribosome recycling factor [Chloroflexota bacterium]
MIKETLHEAENRMKSALQHLDEELAAIRTGRASPALLDRITVEYYGTPTPLNQVASVSAPDATLLVIKPYDPSMIGAIEKTIQSSDLGLTPNSDGQVVRLAIPTLTKERREEYVKMVHKRVEEAKVAVRNIRRDVQDEIRDYEKEKLITEDEMHRGRDDLQKLTDSYTSLIDESGKRKEHEIMEL